MLNAIRKVHSLKSRQVWREATRYDTTQADNTRKHSSKSSL